MASSEGEAKIITRDDIRAERDRLVGELQEAQHEVIAYARANDINKARVITERMRADAAEKRVAALELALKGIATAYIVPDRWRLMSNAQGQVWSLVRMAESALKGKNE